MIIGDFWTLLFVVILQYKVRGLQSTLNCRDVYNLKLSMLAVV